MSMKNFAMAFQIHAAFNGVKAFTDAAVKIKELNSDVQKYKNRMQSVQAEFSKTAGVARFIQTQQRVGTEYMATVGKIQQLNAKIQKYQNRMQSAKTQFSKTADAEKFIQTQQKIGAEYTSTIGKLEKLNAKIQEYQNTMRAAQAELEKLSDPANVTKFIQKQQEIGAEYTKKVKQQERYQKLFDAQSKFEGSFSNMGKYAANTYQYYEAAKGIMSLSDAAAEFQSKLSKVQAITNSSDTEIEKLKSVAMDLGDKTQFSASQAADAMSYLGMAGWKTNQIIAGMPGLLNLAAASGTDLATTADIVSDDLTAFGLRADKAGRLADIMAAASSNANTNVEMMGETFKYAASVAGSLGYTMEDTALATGLMANAGIKASQAGTSLRAIMTRMAKPPKEAAEAFEQFGFSITKKDGSMKTFREAILELRKDFKGLPKDLAASKAASIAGQEAMSGFLSLINASDEDFEKLAQAIDKSSDKVDGFNGAAEKMAKTMQKNAKGGIVELESALSTLKITVGEQLLPILTDGAVYATGFVRSLSGIAKEYPNLIGGSVSLALALTGVGIAGNAAMWIFNGAKAIYYGFSAAVNLCSVAIQSENIALYRSRAALIINTVAHKTWTLAKLAAIATMQIGSTAWALMTGKITLATAATRIMTISQWALNSAFLANPIGLLIAGAVVFVGAITLLYNNIDTLRVSWTMAWVNFQDSYPKIAAVFEGIWKVISAPYNLICAFVNKVKELIGLGPTAAEKVAKTTAVSNNPNDYEHNAMGGIYGKGAFLTTFAEKSPEAAIPIDGSKRATNLWMQTGKLMGLLPKGMQNIEANNLTKNISSSEVTNFTRNVYNSKTNNLTKNISNSDVANLTKNISNSDVANLTKNISNSDVANLTKNISNSDVANLTKNISNSDVANLTKNISNSDVANLTKNINNSNVKNIAKNFSSVYNNTSNESVNQLPGDLLRKTENITSNTRHGDNVSVSFSPQITVNGSADSNTAEMIKQALREEEAKFERRFKEMLSQKRRLSYA